MKSQLKLSYSRIFTCYRPELNRNKKVVEEDYTYISEIKRCY